MGERETTASLHSPIVVHNSLFFLIFPCFSIVTGIVVSYPKNLLKNNDFFTTKRIKSNRSPVWSACGLSLAAEYWRNDQTFVQHKWIKKLVPNQNFDRVLGLGVGVGVGVRGWVGLGLAA